MNFHNSHFSSSYGFSFGFTPGYIRTRSGLIQNPFRLQIGLPHFSLSIDHLRYDYTGDLMESGFSEMTDLSWIHRPIDNIYGEAASRVSMSGNDIVSSYPPGYSISAFEGNASELRQWNPSGVHRWSRSNNFFARLSYNLVDGVSVTAQSFLMGPNSVHLTGELVKGNDRVDAFVNTASWVLFAGEASTFNTTKTGIGVYSTRWRLRVQFHRHGISPLKGRGATGKMYPFHLNINNTHIIFNPKYWKYFY